MISDAEARELKKKSLEKAREAGLLGEDILRNLESVEVKVEAKEELEETGQRIFFGYSYLPEESDGEPEIVIQRRNLADALPGRIRNILNQSAMDHELVGHVGHYFLKKDGQSEENACITQFKMARSRTSDSKAWYLVAIAIPFFQKFHRDVSLSSYF